MSGVPVDVVDEVVVVGAVVVVVAAVVVVVPPRWWWLYRPEADAGATVAARAPATTAIVATNAATLPRYLCRRCRVWLIIRPPRSIVHGPCPLMINASL